MDWIGALSECKIIFVHFKPENYYRSQSSNKLDELQQYSPSA